jgi:AMP phosphorylase
VRVLGAPNMKKAGIYLNKKIGEKASKGEAICTFYSESVYNLKEGKETLANFPFINFK